MELSLIIPVYNKEKNIPLLFDAIYAAMNGIDHWWEVDPSKARATINWEPSVFFRELVTMMVDSDLARLKNNE